MLQIYITTFYDMIGADPVFITFIISFARAIDILLHPIIASITDSIRGKWGRRKPFMFLGSFAFALMLNLLLTPPSNLNKTSINTWFALTYLGFIFCNMFVVIPYNALGPELVESFEDRSNLYFATGMFELGGLFCAVFMPGFMSKNYNLSSVPCPYSNCYGDDGTSTSCLSQPASGEKYNYIIFDKSKWSTSSSSSSYSCQTFNGTYYSLSTKLFNIKTCNALGNIIIIINYHHHHHHHRHHR